jgi:hypothetical protein
MEKVAVKIRFWYSTEVDIEVEDPNDEDEIQSKAEDYAGEFTVWDGNKSWRTDFDDYEIEF